MSQWEWGRGGPLHYFLGITFVMGFIFAVGAHMHFYLRGVLLFVFGLMFGFVVNRISAVVQSKFDSSRFSEAETRAQTYGRLGGIVSASTRLRAFISNPVRFNNKMLTLKKLPKAIYINPPKTVSLSVAEQVAIMA